MFTTFRWSRVHIGDTYRSAYTDVVNPFQGAARWSTCKHASTYVHTYKHTNMSTDTRISRSPSKSCTLWRKWRIKLTMRTAAAKQVSSTWMTSRSVAVHAGIPHIYTHTHARVCKYTTRYFCFVFIRYTFAYTSSLRQNEQSTNCVNIFNIFMPVWYACTYECQGCILQTAKFCICIQPDVHMCLEVKQVTSVPGAWCWRLHAFPWPDILWCHKTKQSCTISQVTMHHLSNNLWLALDHRTSMHAWNHGLLDTRIYMHSHAYVCRFSAVSRRITTALLISRQGSPPSLL